MAEATQELRAELASEDEIRQLAKEHDWFNKQQITAGLRRIGIKAAKGAIDAAAGTAIKSQVAAGTARRPRGKAAAGAPGQRLQADLQDFSQNIANRSEKNKYVAQVTDVFTRKTEAKAIPNKRAGTASKAVAELSKKLHGEVAEKPGGQYTLDTDKGGEFADIGRYAEDKVIHRTVDPEDRNALTTVDAVMGRLKRRMADVVHEKGEQALESNVAGAVRWHNNVADGPDGIPALHGATPSQVAKPNTVANFLVLSDMADKYDQNRLDTAHHVKEIQKTGAFRAANVTDTGGKPIDNKVTGVANGVVRQLAKISEGRGRVQTTTPAAIAEDAGHPSRKPGTTLLKYAKAVHAGSGEIAGRLTEAGVAKRERTESRQEVADFIDAEPQHVVATIAEIEAVNAARAVAGLGKARGQRPGQVAQKWFRESMETMGPWFREKTRDMTTEQIIKVLSQFPVYLRKYIVNRSLHDAGKNMPDTWIQSLKDPRIGATSNKRTKNA